MFIKLLSTLFFALLFTACSSSNDPKEIAIELCEYNKIADYESIKEYADDDLKTQLNDLKVMKTMAKKTKEGREAIEEQEKFLASVNCKESTKVTKQDNGSYLVVNDQSELYFQLKMENGSWKMFK